MRLFTAIDLPEEIKQRLGVFIGRLRPTAKLSWSPVANLHITTKFVGEWPEERLDELKRALSEVPVPKPFEISIRGLGWFPNPRNPRVFWAGIAAPPELAALAAAIDRHTSKLGIPSEERAYQPHLTLARRRDPVPMEALKRELAQIAIEEFGTFRAESFFLYLSAGGRYTQLQEFPFE